MELAELESKEDFLHAFEQIGEQIMLQTVREQKKKARNYKALNSVALKGQILFTGSSLMEGFPVTEMSLSAGLCDHGKKIYNRGIGGYTTDDFLAEIDTVLLDLEPSVVFINIGTNDMKIREDGSDWMEHLAANYDRILSLLKGRLPDTSVYLMAYYPTNHHIPDNNFADDMLKVRTLENIALANARVQELALKYGYQYIDANDGLTDENGELKCEYTIEGIHMYTEGYQIVFRNLYPILKEVC